MFCTVAKVLTTAKVSQTMVKMFYYSYYSLLCYSVQQRLRKKLYQNIASFFEHFSNDVKLEVQYNSIL